jgi:hypothetical protein
MATKKDDWFSRPMMSRIASVLYPGNVDQTTRDEMQAVCDGLGKRSPQQAREDALKSQATAGVAVRTKR